MYQYYTLLYRINLMLACLYFERKNLVLLKSFSTRSDGIIITFTDQSRKLLEIKYVNFTFLINK